MSATPIPTTNAAIGLHNLQAHIEGLERQRAQRHLAVGCVAQLVDLLLLRGYILGRIADYERATDLGEELAHGFPTDGTAFLTRARTRACLHRFSEALADLETAEWLGASGAEVNAECATILQAVGRYDEALAIHEAAVERRRNFETLAARAILHAGRGEVDDAERFFDESRARFRGVEPFGLAQVDFQRAHMWLRHGETTRARAWLLEAWHRVPAFAPAEGHLAELEAEVGERASAIARLSSLAGRSDDPDYAGQLARILTEDGRLEEAADWRAKAAARYAELVVRHPAAFADHAAEFYHAFDAA